MSHLIDRSRFKSRLREPDYIEVDLQRILEQRAPSTTLEVLNTVRAVSFQERFKNKRRTQIKKRRKDGHTMVNVGRRLMVNFESPLTAMTGHRSVQTVMEYQSGE